jgi:hypothetical protein
MTTTQVIHACNRLIDYLGQAAKTPEATRQITALNEIKADAVAAIGSEIAD